MKKQDIIRKVAIFLIKLTVYFSFMSISNRNKPGRAATL